MKYIKNLFEKQSVWRALTEYMRFQADIEQEQIMEINTQEDKYKYDTHAQVKINRL